MKFLDPGTIKKGEQRLVDFLVDHLNWKAVKKAVQEQFDIDKLKEDISIDSGDIIIFNHEIAYQLELGPQSGVSMVINRSGELIDMVISESKEQVRERVEKTDSEIAEETAAIEKAASLASEIAEMILQINLARHPRGRKE